MEPILCIRRAAEVDIAAIRAVAEVSFRCTYRSILSPGQLDYMMDWMYSPESLARQLAGGHVFYLLEETLPVSGAVSGLDGGPVQGACRGVRCLGYVSVEREGFTELRGASAAVGSRAASAAGVQVPAGEAAGARVPLYHLQKLYLLPSEQGRGLGRRLFETAVAHVRADAGGPAVMELNVNRRNRAVSFYESMGMHRDREGDFAIGEGYYMNDYIMRLEL